VSGAAAWTQQARCGSARAGTLVVRGRSVQTPTFMPVGTYGAVKGLMPDVLRHVGTRMLVANACHLHDRPGADVVAALGGLHRFMNWDGLLLTDSGGFQVFSMLAIAQLDDLGVTFQSPIDGRSLRLGPREAMDVQLQLDADIAMTFDHCPPLPAAPELVALAVERTTRWSELARERHAARNPAGQALFGIVQGGLDDALRARSASELIAMDFDGYAVGGLSVGEESPQLQAALARYAPLLPESQARYAMGIGGPSDVLAAIAAGFDLFDSVLPTRNGRHGTVFTSDGAFNLRAASHRLQSGPLEAGCDCPACLGWSVGALRHLFVSHDPLAGALCAAHNLRHLHRLVGQARAAIVAGEFLAPELREPS
jgi:queuine tRNA-ribosyltransferase